ncbi:MAG: 5'/3'-nucleotidase SurE [Planctomycetaceae bacterium]
MQLLLTNDDGIDAPGLATLAEVAAAHSDIILVAPAAEQSGVGHRVTDKQPIRVHKHQLSRFAVEGTPADCARLGLLHLAPGTHWLLSGINAGGNLGSDIYMSGTVAAAREAALLGYPAIALSQYRFFVDRPCNWSRAARWAARVVNELFALPIAAGEFWNVNFPDPEADDAEPDLVVCPVDSGHHAVAFENTAAGFLYSALSRPPPRRRRRRRHLLRRSHRRLEADDPLLTVPPVRVLGSRRPTGSLSWPIKDAGAFAPQSACRNR